MRGKRATFTYILSGQNFIKNANAKKKVRFGEFLKIWIIGSNSVNRQVSFNSWKLVENEMFWMIFKHCACDTYVHTQFKIPWYIFKLQIRKYFPVKNICHLRYLRILQSSSLYYFSPFFIFEAAGEIFFRETTKG